mgnify:FL=1
MEGQDKKKEYTDMAQDSINAVSTHVEDQVEYHKQALENLEQTAGHDYIFQAQASMINQSIQDIGMGKYQWALFCLAGYGWLCDQVCTIPQTDGVWS